MPKKDIANNKDSKEKSEKVVKKESSNGKESKAKEKEIGKEVNRKEPTTSKDSKAQENDSVDKSTKNTMLKYELNSKVLCKHRDTLYYEAKVIAIDTIPDKGKVFTVHYQGWNSRHDEKIFEVDAAERFLPCTEENLEMARAEMQEARLMEKKRKGKKVTTLSDDKKSGGADSRGSTPSEKVSSRPSTVTTVEKNTSVTSTSRKRKFVSIDTDAPPIDEFGIPKPEIKIEIPIALKDILVDDQDMIVRQLHLIRLPARNTVEDIIKQYADYTGVALNGENEITFDHNGSQTKITKETLIESSHGVQDYFNTTLGSQLLYKFERLQYAELFKKKTEELGATKKAENGSGNADFNGDVERKKWRPSDTYGFIHLLRLFVKFGSMLGLTNWSDKAVKSIVGHVHDFLAFLEKNRHKFYDIEKDYIVAAPEYQKRVWNA